MFGGKRMGVPLGVAPEMSPEKGLQAIPLEKRNAYERDYAKAGALLQGAESMAVTSLQDAAAFSRRLLAAKAICHESLSLSNILVDKCFVAASHVERFTSVHYYFFDPANGNEVTVAEKERMVRAGRKHIAFTSKSLLDAYPYNPQAFGTMSADELVLVWLSMLQSELIQDSSASYNAAGRMRYDCERIIFTVLPEVAIAAEAELGLGLGVDVWRSEFSYAIAGGYYLALGTGSSPAKEQTTGEFAKEWAERAAVYQPNHPRAYSVLLHVLMAIHDPVGLHNAARNMYALCVEVGGDDYHAALARFYEAYAVFCGALSKEGERTFRLGDVRSAYAQATPHLQRLKRWHMDASLKRIAGGPRLAVKEMLKDKQREPDGARLPLPKYLTKAVGMLPPSEAMLAQLMLEARQQPQVAGSSAAMASLSSAAASRAVEGSSTGGPRASDTSSRVAARECDGCSNAFYNCSLCAGCKSRRYCSKKCQAAHWKAVHKGECKQLAAAKLEAAQEEARRQEREAAAEQAAEQRRRRIEESRQKKAKGKR